MSEADNSGNNINQNAARMIAVFSATLLAAVLVGILQWLLPGTGNTLGVILAAMVSAAIAVALADYLRPNGKVTPAGRIDELITQAMAATATTDRNRLIEAGLRLLIRQANEQRSLNAAAADSNAQTIRKDNPPQL
ncbi:MAG: hypothetical protein ACFHX7_08200 [Pseudomonadota bacterium]